MRRFINADGFVSTGQGFAGYNMFAYCQNNPVGYMDSNGNRCVSVVNADFLGGKAEEISKPRADLVSAPDLDVETEKAYKYNCYGNAISKVVLTSPTGYKRGDSAQATYEAVVKDLGKNNVRILESIDSPINKMNIGLL